MLTASSPVFGPPTLTLAQWSAALAGSPVASEAAALYAEVTAAGVDPAVALGQFAAESSYGTAGYAVTTHGWGNQTWAGWETTFGATPYAPGNGYTYAAYPDWQHGLAAYLYLLGQYRTWGWAGSLGTMCAYWLSGSATLTPRVTRYVDNIISAVQAALATNSYRPTFQSERGDPDGQIDDCTPRSTGMLLDWMTHGAQTGADLPDRPGGDDLASMAVYAQTHYGLDIGCLYATPPSFAQLDGFRGGMVIQGLYRAVPAPYNRFDPTYTGGHAVFALRDDGGFFVMDPLAPADGSYAGEYWPGAVVAAYATALSGNGSVLCAVPSQENPMVTLTGTPGYYDAPIGAQIYQLDGVSPLCKLENYPPQIGIYSPGATSATQRAVIITHDRVAGIVAIMNDADLTLRGSSTAPVTIADLFPPVVTKFLQDALEAAAASVGALNVAPYLAQITAGGTFHIATTEALLFVVCSAVGHGVVSALRRDAPGLLAWLGLAKQ